MSGWAALGAVAGSIGGTLLSAEAQRAAASKEYDRQKEFAQTGIQWRVRDAEAAGLHPLFALGANVPTYSPGQWVDPGFRQMGQDVGAAVSRAVDQDARHARQLQLDVLGSQVDLNSAHADYYRSLAMRERTSGQSQGIPSFEQNDPIFSDVVKPKPDEVISSRFGDRSVTSGTHSAFNEFTITPAGLKMLLPRGDEGSGPGEVWGELSWYDKIAIINMNMNRYGEGWFKRFVLEFLGGKSPTFVGGRIDPFTRTIEERRLAPEPYPRGGVSGVSP